jgi:hypothetical protein
LPNTCPLYFNKYKRLEPSASCVCIWVSPCVVIQSRSHQPPVIGVLDIAHPAENQSWGAVSSTYWYIALQATNYKTLRNIDILSITNYMTLPWTRFKNTKSST